MDFFKVALKAIPDAAASPLGLISFVFVILCYTVLALKVKRNKQLLDSLDKIPEKDRFKVLEAEMGSVRLRSGLSPEQWLRHRLNLYYLLALVLFCVTLLLIVVVVVAYGRKPEGSVKVEVGMPSSGFRIDPDGHVQKASYQPVSNEYNAESGNVEKCPPDRTLTYTYAREADVPHISYTMPYLELLREGGPILGIRYRNSPFQWQFPNISVMVANSTSQQVTLSEAVFEVLTSTVVDEPVLVVDDLSVNKIALVNEGWGDVVNPVVTFSINDFIEGGGISIYQAESHTEAIPTFTDGAAIPIKSYIPARLQDDDKVMVEGQIVHGPAASRKTVRFKTRVALQITAEQAPPPSYLYEVSLKAGVTPQTVPVPIHQIIDKSDNFLIRVKSDKSARFKLRVSFRAVGGGMVPANDVLLDILVPRSQAKYSTPKPKTEVSDAKA